MTGTIPLQDFIKDLEKDPEMKRKLDKARAEVKPLFGHTKKCLKCDGTGWLEGKDHEDGSYSTMRPCTCTGYIVSD